ncbi:MAG: hypothetical protein LLG40_13980 [Deltaproteobacteria bacterium]|nr:hypothetical protein [Deltaproteobacteria bacterium]
MSEEVIKGIIDFARREIERRIKKESERIVGEVIAETMNNLQVEMIENKFEYKTDLIFKFKK